MVLRRARMLQVRAQWRSTCRQMAGPLTLFLPPPAAPAAGCSAPTMWRVALGLAGVGLGADLAALERRLAAQARGAETPGGLSERADSSPLCDAYAQTRMQ